MKNIAKEAKKVAVHCFNNFHIAKKDPVEVAIKEYFCESYKTLKPRRFARLRRAVCQTRD